jgi:hypothetical protein
VENTDISYCSEYWETMSELLRRNTNVETPRVKGAWRGRPDS